MGSSEEFDFSRLTEAPERAADRDSMFLQADVVRDSTGESDSCRVRNVSAGGAMAETQKTYVVGDRVTVTLRNIGQVKGEIAWVANSRVGITFDSPIDPMIVRGSGRPRS